MVVRFTKPVAASNRIATPALAGFKNQPVAAAVGRALTQWQPQASASEIALTAQFSHRTHQLEVNGKLLTGTFRFGRQTYNFRADIAQEGKRLVLSDVSLRPPFSETKFAFDFPARERAAALRARFVKGIDHPEPEQRGASRFGAGVCFTQWFGSRLQLTDQSQYLA